MTSLQERFGREDMLVEVYVRDLIALILETVQNNGQVSLSSLYNKLSSQLRALSNLGVTTDKCAAILYPIVESTLPEEELIAWERHRIQIIKQDVKPTAEDHLDSLMKFLKKEVEGSERIRLAREFSGTSTTDTLSRLKTNIPTAASLVNAGGRSNHISSPDCIFCDGKHTSENCCKAISKSLEERKTIVEQKRGCFRCLKPGHYAKKCKAKVKCACCMGRHWAILCTGPLRGNLDNQSKNEDNSRLELTKSVELSNIINRNSGNLQTLIVLIHGPVKKKIVRVMLDCGSEKSYILKATAKELELKKTGQEEVIHLLFGAVETKPQTHTTYTLHISNLESTFHCHFAVSDSIRIAGEISDSTRGRWIDELQQNGVKVPTYDRSLDKADIKVLVGNDIYAKLLTGRKVELRSGLGALETKLGWTVSGKINSIQGYQEKYVHKIPTTIDSFHIQDMPTEQLRDKDVIEITGCEEDLRFKRLRSFEDTGGRLEHKTRLFPGEEEEDSATIVLPQHAPVATELFWSCQDADSFLLTKLGERYWTKVVGYNNLEKIWWKFNPPIVPWVDGFWNQIICIAKKTLRDALDPRSRFRKEYIGMFVSCSSGKSQEVKVGEVALIGFNNVKRLNWSLEILVEVSSEEDGDLRLAKSKNRDSSDSSVVSFGSIKKYLS